MATTPDLTQQFQKTANKIGIKLLLAAQKNDMAKVQEIIDVLGNPALEKFASIKQQILDTTQHYYGYSALTYTVRNGNANMTKLLIEAGADINNIKMHDRDTALMWAARNGNIELMQTLISAGADVNDTNIYGDTALMLSVRNGQTDAVKTLIKTGVDVCAVNKVNRATALSIAQEKGRRGIAEIIKEKVYDKSPYGAAIQAMEKVLAPQ